MSFNDIIGHDMIKFQIENSIKSGMVSHAHLFLGEDGTGKSLLAEELALKIIGREVKKDYVDIVKYKKLNTQSVVVDDIRNIVEEVNKKPFEGDKKVIIIYNSDKMTVQAQNALLKTIEEPPKGVYIILLCENIESILPTIVSRCQVHKLKRLSEDEILEFISKKNSKINENDAKVIASLSDGIAGRAEMFLSDDSFKDIRNKLLDLINDIYSADLYGLLGYEKFFIKYKNKYKEILTWILSFIRDILVYKETGDTKMILNLDKITSIKELATKFSFVKLNDIINVVENTSGNLKSNVNPQLTFDMMLLNFK